MYYSAGTYEAFAHPEKPKDVDKKSAYIIGTGLAGLTAAFLRNWSLRAEAVTDARILQRVSICVAVVKWIIISR